MKIIFDFDHTLFSAKKLYFALKEAFLKLGVEENLFKETFEKSKIKKRGYDPDKQIQLIVKVKPEIKKVVLKRQYKKTLKRATQFLYSDTTWFLREWQKKANLILLSYGEEKFQRDKIKDSRIEKYFYKKVKITGDIYKIKPFKKFFANKDEIIFIEDNPTALAETKKIFPKVITVRINRGEGRYAREPNNSKIDFSIKNLKELDKILSSLKMRILKVNQKNLKEVTETVQQLVKEGKVIICPTDTVYGLICDATNIKAVRGLLKIKRRPKNKPIPIFVKNLKMAKKIAEIDKKQEQFLKSVWPGKVTAVLKRKNKLPKILFGETKTIGLRIPNYKIINQLLLIINRPLTGTSANISGKPASGNLKEVTSQFKDQKYQPDLIVDAGNLLQSKPSVVLDLTSWPPKILRI